MSGLQQNLPDGARDIWRRTVPVWVGLVALLGLTLTLAYLPLGKFNVVAAIGIALAKALLVVLFFMHLKRPDPLLRLAGMASLLWLFFMFSLTLTDILARQPETQPGTVLPRTQAPSGSTAGQRAF